MTATKDLQKADPLFFGALKVPTGRALIQLSTSTADNSIILLPGSNFSECPLPADLGSTYSHMLVQNEIPILQTCEALIQAKSAGLVTVFNPSPIPSKDQVDTLIPWESIDWLLVNEDETADLARAFGHANGDALEQLGRSLPHATGIVMTKGSAGVETLLATSENRFIRLKSPCGQALQPVTNTTGAGDTFAVRLGAVFLPERESDELCAFPLTTIGIPYSFVAEAQQNDTRGGRHALHTAHSIRSSHSLLREEWCHGGYADDSRSESSLPAARGNDANVYLDCSRVA